MASNSVVRCAIRSVSRGARAPLRSSATIATPMSTARQVHSAPAAAAALRSPAGRRPRAFARPGASVTSPAAICGKRTLFIQTEATPNEHALKFKPDQRILPENFASPFLEYLSPRATVTPPHPSPLAGQLLGVDGVTAVFYGPDYITITKDSSVPWAHVKPEVFSLITEAVTSGQPIVNTVAGKAGDDGQESAEQDSLAYDENDDEVVGAIKELLETRIRPAIQEDGGDIEFRGFHDGQVLLKLRGACRTCDSSTVTLRNGIESMLMHYVEEVKGVQQVMDQEEEVAMQEFAKFEEKLRQQKGPDAVPSTTAKGSIDTVEG